MSVSGRTPLPFFGHRAGWEDRFADAPALKVAVGVLSGGEISLLSFGAFWVGTMRWFYCRCDSYTARDAGRVDGVRVQTEEERPSCPLQLLRLIWPRTCLNSLLRMRRERSLSAVALRVNNSNANFDDRQAAHVVMEASGTAHYWARRLGEGGMRVSLLPPHYVRAYVRRNKN